MSDVSIKVNIAGRAYPLTVNSAEEPGIRRAEQSIEESIQLFQKNYAVKDKQDLLAMAALQMSAKAEKNREPIIQKVVERVEVPADFSDELREIETILDAYLS
jgi:cell division protein ZapA (FtsZ GTPase activity inhibitor)